MLSYNIYRLVCDNYSSIACFINQIQVFGSDYSSTCHVVMNICGQFFISVRDLLICVISHVCLGGGLLSVCPSCMAKTLTLHSRGKLCNQILSYLPCLETRLTATIVMPL